MYNQPFNPNYIPQYQPQFQMYQAPAATPAGVAGRIVSDFNEITIKDIPTDGSWAYFVKADGSQIQARRWSENGSVISAVYGKQEAVQGSADPIQERLEEIENRLEKIEKARTTKRRDVADE